MAYEQEWSELACSIILNACVEYIRVVTEDRVDPYMVDIKTFRQSELERWFTEGEYDNLRDGLSNGKLLPNGKLMLEMLRKKCGIYQPKTHIPYPNIMINGAPSRVYGVTISSNTDTDGDGNNLMPNTKEWWKKFDEEKESSERDDYGWDYI